MYQKSGDDLMDACKSVYSAMRLDFGERFMKQFRERNDAKAWINRLYARLDCVASATLVDAYTRAVENHRPHMPSLDDVVVAAKALSGERKRQADQLEYVNAPRLPAGSGLAGYIKYLEAEAEGDVAKGCIAMMREILAKPDPATHEEQQARLTKAVEAHDKLLAMVPIRPRVYGERRECGKTGCNRPGTISHDARGEGPWFCAEHCR